MAPLRRVFPLLAASALAAACDDTIASPDHPGRPLPVARAVLEELPAYCGASTVTPLIADGVTDVGTVTVYQDGAMLYVVYRVREAAYTIQSTSLFVGSSAQSIPTSGGGSPRLGQFPYRSANRDAWQVVWAVSLDEVGRGTLVVAAFAEVGRRKAGAWGAGERLTPSGSWATWFTHTVSDCGAATVGGAGGTVSVPSEPGQAPAVELEIPEGALDGPTVITIDPANVSDLGIGSGAPGVAGVAAAGSAPQAVASPAAVVPIEGTVWELKPNGLRFNKPVTVRIRYAPDNVPDGVDPSTFRIYLLGGDGLEGGFGVADPSRARVEAEIEHFSYAFVGFEEGTEGTADLSVQDVGLSPSGDLAPGASLTVTATLGNDGPDDATGVVVRYRLTGNATLAPLTEDCEDVSEGLSGAVEALCQVGSLAAGASAVSAPAVAFVLPAEGSYTVEAEVTSALEDLNLENNTALEGVTVVAPPVEADLQVKRFDGMPDPVEAGGSVTYEIDVVAANATEAVSGATLAVRFQGGAASLVSADAGCAAVVGGVDCTLPTLQPDQAHTVGFMMALTEPNTVVSAEATVVGPDGLVDPDGDNNHLTRQVTVIPAPTGGWVESGVLPAAGQVVSREFAGSAGQWIRVHASLVSNVSGSARLSLEGPSGTVLYPVIPGTAEGWATSLSSANQAVNLPIGGTYRLSVESAAAGASYRVGLGTGRGRRDPGFGALGIGEVTVARGTDGGFHLTRMVLAGNDILTVGHRWLRRFDASGSPVTGFGVSGAVDLPAVLAGARGKALVVQPDGRIVVAALSTTSPRPWKVARFNADGSLDTSFGVNGVATIPVGTSTRTDVEPVGVALQPHGAGLRIIVAGVANHNLTAVGLARLTAEGALDATFGAGGVVLDTGFNPLALGVQSDGGILVMGAAEMIRFLPDGGRDAGVGVGGLINWSTLGAPTTARATNLRVVSGDRIVVVGLNGTDAFAMRLTSAGALDPGFAATGWTSLDFGLADRFQDLAQDGLGNLLLVGRQLTSGGDREFLVVRLLSSGVLDATFGHAGYTLEHRVDDALSVSVDAEGRIVVGGEAPGTTSSVGLQILRLLPN